LYAKRNNAGERKDYQSDVSGGEERTRSSKHNRVDLCSRSGHRKEDWVNGHPFKLAGRRALGKFYSLCLCFLNGIWNEVICRD
jgi:hypothetical protein